MVRTTITSKGQTTVPLVVRKGWKGSQILWEVKPDGSAIVRPAPDVRTLLGAAGSKARRDPRELDKARVAIATDAETRKKRR